jgi:hypothetical protein
MPFVCGDTALGAGCASMAALLIIMTSRFGIAVVRSRLLVSRVPSLRACGSAATSRAFSVASLLVVACACEAPAGTDALGPVLTLAGGCSAGLSTGGEKEAVVEGRLSTGACGTTESDRRPASKNRAPTAQIAESQAATVELLVQRSCSCSIILASIATFISSFAEPTATFFASVATPTAAHLSCAETLALARAGRRRGKPPFTSPLYIANAARNPI